MRRVAFTETERHRHLFGVMFAVWAGRSKPPENFDQLATASAIKKKLCEVSVQPNEGRNLERELKPGPQELVLKQSEWEYLRDRLTPPKADWGSNLTCDEALEILELLKEAPQVEEKNA